METEAGAIWQRVSGHLEYVRSLHIILKKKNQLESKFYLLTTTIKSPESLVELLLRHKNLWAVCLIKGSIHHNCWWEMSKEPKALKCFLIAQSSNINQFNHALRLPPTAYVILIFEQKVDGCVLIAGEGETTYGGPSISTCSEAKKDESCLPIQGIWLQLLRSFSQMQTNWAFSGKGITRHKKADGWEDQWRRMARWKKRM